MPPRHDDPRLGKTPRQDRRLDIAVAAGVQFIAAARQIDGAFQPAAENDDAVDARRQFRPLEPLTSSGESSNWPSEVQVASARMRKAPAIAAVIISGAAKRPGDQAGSQQEDGQIERLDKEPEDFGEEEEHRSNH